MNQVSKYTNLISSFIGTCLIVSIASFAPTGRADEAILPSKGVGPITAVKLESLNEAQAKAGKEVFTKKCAACHKLEERYVGPSLKGITTGKRPDKRPGRTPEWIMNMMLNPAEMIQKDPDAAKVFEEFLIPMTFQNINEAEARSVLEYFRQYDAKGGEEKNHK